MRGMWNIPAPRRECGWSQSEGGYIGSDESRGWRNQISGALDPSEALGPVSRFLTPCSACLTQTVLIHRREWEKLNGEAYGRGRRAWALGFLFPCKPLSLHLESNMCPPCHSCEDSVRGRNTRSQWKFLMGVCFFSLPFMVHLAASSWGCAATSLAPDVLHSLNS